jgi:hypothetical protein
MLGIRSKRWVFCCSWVLLIMLCSLLAYTPVATAATDGDIQSSMDKLLGYYNRAAEYNDWEALGIRWAGVDGSSKYTVPKDEELLAASDYARAILGSIAIGQDRAVVSNYVYNLVEMQQPDGETKGSFITEGNETLNQTIWAVIALDFAKKNGFTANYQRADAVNYICSKQDGSGGFDGSGYGVEVDSTAHALIALSPDYQQPGKDAITATIINALVYLKEQQMDSGGFGGWGSENSDTTAAVIEAFMALGIDPLADDWLENDNNMVDALLTYQSNQGWFVYSNSKEPWNDPTKPNRMSTCHSLLALGDLVRGQSKYSSILPGNGVPGGNAGNGGIPGNVDPGQQQSSALITVRGDAEKGTILEYTSYQWKGSSTALEALKGVLDQKGISYVISGEYVRSVAALAEKKEGYPLSGWLFRINGIFPGVGAGSAIIGNGDRVEWLYTLDGGKDVGVVISTKPEEPKQEQKEEVKDDVSKMEEDSLTINEQEEVKQQHQVSFPDVDVNFDWAREAIENLATKGIIKGTGSGYEPARNISRAEMLALLLKAKGTNLETAGIKFTDIKADDWYYDFIATADKQGWISGYPDSTFRPDDPISRNEIACLVNRIFPADNGKTFSGKTGFSDQENIPAWAQQAASNLQQRGIISGYPDGSFKGEGKLTRAEAAVIIYKLAN